MKKKYIYILVWIFIFSSVSSVISSSDTSIKLTCSEPIGRDYSHIVLAEFGTQGGCVPCGYAHSALKIIYANQWHPFYYISLICSKNKHAHQRAITELGLIGYPTIFWDGGFRKNIGAPDVETAMELYNTSISKCGDRNVKDIDLYLDVEWLGAVNNHPEDGENLVPIETVFNWTISEMEINVDIANYEASTYNGHLHVYVTQKESEWWNDYFGNPYTFAFLDYAFNEDVSLSSGGSWDDSIGWDGLDYNDGYGNYFENITQDNIMVIAAVFDEDNDDYVDETAGFSTGEGTDPKIFDVYFGDTNPPPLVISNGSAMKYDPYGSGDLNWTTTYYWKVDVWNNKNEPTYGDVWSFTTRGNDPPNEPLDKVPRNGTGGHPINIILTWFGGDPDGDETTYDIYFEEFDPFEDPKQVKENHTEETYDPSPIGTLDFATKYEWKIVSWDYYGLNTSGEVWWFETEPNYPPDPAKNLRPPDGVKNVPVNASLFWNGSDPNEGDTLYYDVFFGLYDPPTQQTTKQSQAYYDPYGEGDMQLYETYYWKIGTWDKSGEYSETDVHTFQTGINLPPSDPNINGPNEGGTDIVYDFKFVSTDPENNTIKYIVDWGDDTIDETIFVDNGTEVTLNHSWKERNTYTIKARVIDEYGAVSDWTEHEIIIPRQKAISKNYNILNLLFKRFPILNRLLCTLI